MQMIKSDSTTDDFNDSGSDSINVDSRPTTPDEAIVKKEEEVEIEENQHDKVKPLEPLPEQTIGKTKIFKPNELMVKTLNQLECNVITKTRIDLSSAKNRPSAFFIPAKRSKVNDGISYIAYTSDKSPNTITQNKSQILSNLAIRKRVHETKEMIKPISITSTIDDTKEIESFYTYDVIPPRPNEYKLYSSIATKSQDEFILRRETRREFIEKHERDIYKLQHQLTLNQRSDPFMGCTYRRLDNEHEKTDSVLRYEGFDEFSTNVAYKEKHWVE